MRERGITRPGRKAVISAAITLLGAAALSWSLVDPAGAPPPARPLGLVALVLGALATLNFLYALSLVRRMQRGEDGVATWTVPPATMARFLEQERQRKRGKNNWRGWRREWPQGLPVTFSTRAVLVGHTYFRLASRGISRFTFVHIEGNAPAAVQFAMTLTVAGAGTQGRTARYRGHLRVPIADDAHLEAARAVGHFRSMVS